MARPIKDRLDYFPHDVDMSNDEKVEAMEALYGNDGYAFFNKLLERIYRSGGQLKFEGKDNIIILAKKCNVNMELFEQMLKSAFVLDLFDKDLGKEGILTSNGIKARVSIVIDKRVKMKALYTSKKVSGTVSSLVSAAETPPETRQSKEKESKEKESKENIIGEASPKKNESEIPLIPSLIIPEEEKEKSSGQKEKRFIKPTQQELEDYFFEIAMDDPKQAAVGFLNHYETVGWIVGKNKLPMKSWKGACGTWKSNHEQYKIKSITKNANEQRLSATSKRAEEYRQYRQSKYNQS